VPPVIVSKVGPVCPVHDNPAGLLPASDQPDLKRKLRCCFEVGPVSCDTCERCTGAAGRELPCRVVGLVQDRVNADDGRREVCELRFLHDALARGAPYEAPGKALQGYPSER